MAKNVETMYKDQPEAIEQYEPNEEYEQTELETAGVDAFVVACTYFLRVHGRDHARTDIQGIQLEPFAGVVVYLPVTSL